MTITLNLPADLEQELSAAAARLGIPLSEYALRVLAENRALITGSEAPLTGAELVAYWEREGLIGSRPDVEDPVDFARALREQAQNRNHS